MTSPQPIPQNQLVLECMQSLRRIVKALESYSRSVEKRFGLTGPQLWALWELGQNSPLGIKDLSAHMRLDPSTVVGVVDRLALKGLVTREADASDRRRVSLLLTPQGADILAAAPHPAQGHLLAGLEAMAPERVLGLRDALKTLETVMHAEALNAPFFFAEE